MNASHSCEVRLSFLLVELVRYHTSSSTALMYASRAGSQFLGGFHVLFFLNLSSSGSYSSLSSGS